MQKINACIKFSPTASQSTPLPHQCHHPQRSPSFFLLSTRDSIHSSQSQHSHIPLAHLLHYLTSIPIPVLHRNYGQTVPRIRESRRRLQESPSQAHRRRATPGTYPNPETLLSQLYATIYRLGRAKLTYPALRIVQDRNRRGFRRGY